jgi:hypothetical protein
MTARRDVVFDARRNRGAALCTRVIITFVRFSRKCFIHFLNTLCVASHRCELDSRPKLFARIKVNFGSGLSAS